MLGTINGAFVNRVVLNGRGGEILVTGDAFVIQDGAVSSSAGAVALAGYSSHTFAGHALAGSGAASVGAALDALQSGALMSDGSVLVASMAEWTHDDHTLLVRFSALLRRHQAAGSPIARKSSIGSLSPHQGGQRFTVH